MIDYAKFLADCFYLKTKEGQIVPFNLNEVQSDYLDILSHDYPSMQGIRENILKGRQFGISTLWTGIFTADFIMSSIGEIDLVDSDIYSHKDAETTAHFNRVNMFLDSWLLKSQGGDYAQPEHHKVLPELRRAFLKIDTSNQLVARNGTTIQTQTASAKVSGRGSTVQNIHWTEPAFYPDTTIMSARNLITGAEEQVPQGFGKIVRESTGRLISDYYAEEYYLGKDRKSDFKSRFLAWFTFKGYSSVAPDDWTPPDYYKKLVDEGLATVDQCYWHFMKTRGLTDKTKLREYPTTDIEAFLFGGENYFNSEALLNYTKGIVKPIKASEFVGAL